MQNLDEPAQRLPPIPSPTGQGSGCSGHRLQCPYCQARFVLSWEMYSHKDSPCPEYECPVCREKSMLKLPCWAYWFSSFTVLGMAAILFSVDLSNCLSKKLFENFGILAGYKEKKN